MARPPDAERRQALLTAARRWLEEHGAVGFSLRELARGIGETHRALLHHFGSKEALFLQVLEASRLQDRPGIVRAAVAREAAPSPAALLRREWAYLSSAENDAALRLYYDVLSLAMRNPKRFRHPELTGEEWIGTIAGVAERVGMPRARARAFGTFVLAAVRGLLLDLLINGERVRVQRGFEDLAAAVEHLVGSLGDERSAGAKAVPRGDRRTRRVRASSSTTTRRRTR